METDTFDKSKINQVFALLANPENEPPDFGEENQMKSKLKKVYETFQINATNLNSQQQIKLAELLTEFKDLWDEQKREDPLTQTIATEHKIETDATAKPVCTVPQKTTLAEDYIIWKYIDKMVKRKVIQPSTSPCASPILLADKKNGKIRFCVDFYRLNNVTKKDVYSLPRMDTILEALAIPHISHQLI